MAIFTIKKHSLRTRDDQRTKASELTLRQSIYPLCLVTILFFLWVRWNSRRSYHSLRGIYSSFAGFLLRSARYLEQTLPEHAWYLESPIKWTASGIFWFARVHDRPCHYIVAEAHCRCLSFGISRSCELDPSTFRIQSRLYLGLMPLRNWRIDSMALFAA